MSRITPACAGKTYLEVTFDDEPEDHPRVCGKNLQGDWSGAWETGSPPRVREKLTKGGRLQAINGITPACAGKTGAFLFLIKLLRDHPRVCGKNFQIRL